MDTSKPFSLLSTVFLFAGFIALGTLLCFLQMQYRVHDEVNARLNRAVVEMDFIFSRAEVTAASVSPLVGRDCTDMLLTKLRSIVAGTPFIRSISFVRHDEIYCTTVLGGIVYKDIHRYFRDGDLLLLSGNTVTPGRPFIVYRQPGNPPGNTLVGIDAFFIYSILKSVSSLSPVSLVVGDTILSANGKINSYHVYSTPITLHSDHFRYSVISELPSLYRLDIFLWQERFSMILVLVISVFLTFLLNRYLTYIKTLEFQLRRAIRRREIVPFIQPIVDAGTERIVGGEVLLRWEHPEHGSISPDIFITLAEQTGLIHDLTRSCFKSVATALPPVKTNVSQPLFLCFNISANHFENDEIVTLCRDFIARIPSGQFQLVLEITERALVTETDMAESISECLRKLGVKLSLDDFGTGNANYSYIQRFKPHFIKIDKTFTRYVNKDELSGLIIENMVKIAKKTGSEIVAEGIELQEQKKAIQQYEVSYLQGFLFSKAVPVSEFINLLNKQSD